MRWLYPCQECKGVSVVVPTLTAPSPFTGLYDVSCSRCYVKVFVSVVFLFVVNFVTVGFKALFIMITQYLGGLPSHAAMMCEACEMPYVLHERFAEYKLAAVAVKGQFVPRKNRPGLTQEVLEHVDFQ